MALTQLQDRARGRLWVALASSRFFFPQSRATHEVFMSERIPADISQCGALNCAAGTEKEKPQKKKGRVCPKGALRAIEDTYDEVKTAQ